jgi:hypothetical protein
MKKLGLVLLGFFVLSACETAPKLTPQQRRAMQMRTFETTYGNVFKAIKTVFQDEGYVIKNQDYDGGMILAQKETSSGGGAAFMAALGGNQNYVTGRGYEISMNLDALNKKLVETRMTLQSRTQTSLGGASGKEIVKPEIYKALYQKIFVEVERRKARGL